MDRHLALAVAGLLILAAGEASPAAFVDAVLAEAGDTVITASDVALARGLRLFGLQPSEAPVQPEELQRFVDALVVAEEATRLQIAPTEGEGDAAWNAAAMRVGGMEALLSWLDGNGIDRGWARRTVEADLRRRQFIALRFRAFAFVPEAEVVAALGPGFHTPQERERVRESLLAAATQESLAAWIQEARGRVRVRSVESDRRAVPIPFPMPSPALRHPSRP
jgi:hypothetical protein